MQSSGIYYWCKSCDWSQTVQPTEAGVILEPNEGFLECPECGELDLEMILVKPKTTSNEEP